jgi:ribonuclease P protein component
MVPLACFSRQVRLLHSREFQRVFNNTDFKSVDSLLIVLAARNDSGYSRLGLAIAKKKINSAVGRNRLKRLIRESFRQFQHDLCSVDLVIMCQSRAAEASNQQIFDSLQNHWKNVISRCNEFSSS